MSSLRFENALITGGAGFIGSHIAESLEVYGEGKQRRCFSFVTEVVEVLIQLIECSAADGEIVNVGNDVEISMNDLARLVIQISKSQSDIVHIPFEKASRICKEDNPHWQN